MKIHASHPILNPDFDQTFEVFYDPFARKTTALEGELITWTGDMHRVFLIRKPDGTVTKVKKNSYKKDFYELFGSCEALRNLPKPDFKDMEHHILLYEEHCADQL